MTTQLVQLFVNGTIVFSDMTDEVDALLVKVDGKVFVRTSAAEQESVVTLCPAGKHTVIRTKHPLPCPFCIRAETLAEEKA